MVFKPEGRLVPLGVCPWIDGAAILVLAGLEDRQLGHRADFFMVSIVTYAGLL
jgi:hypothetical protein